MCVILLISRKKEFLKFHNNENFFKNNDFIKFEKPEIEKN